MVKTLLLLQGATRKVPLTLFITVIFAVAPNRKPLLVAWINMSEYIFQICTEYIVQILESCTAKEMNKLLPCPNLDESSRHNIEQKKLMT